jgi:endonuclease-8
LYGAFTDSEVPMGPPVGEVRMRMVGADFGTDLRGPTACDVLDEAQADAVIAGIGNVYRNELLFRHGIDPHRPGRAVDAAEFDSMWTDLVELMRVGYRRGKIHVVRPEHDRGAPSYAQGRPRTYVYRRAGDPCRVCGTTVLTEVLEGRNVFWCPTCQT